MKAVQRVKEIWARLIARAPSSNNSRAIPTEYLSALPAYEPIFPKIIAKLVFGKEAIEDFHCETALMNGTDQYGRIFVDFEEKRRHRTVRNVIWAACKNAQARNAKSET